MGTKSSVPDLVLLINGRLHGLKLEIAAYFGVHVDTLHEWQTVYTEFSDAIKRGRTGNDVARWRLPPHLRVHGCPRGAGAGQRICVTA